METNVVEAQCIEPLQHLQPPPKNKFGPQSKNLASIIRDKKSLENIRQYIFYNPAKWHRDRNNDNGLWI